MNEQLYTITESTIAEWYDLKESGKISLSCAVQRNEMPAWSKPEKADLLIDSILNGWSINLIHYYLSDGVNVCLDGKQRLTIIYRILDDQYTPTALTGSYSILNGKPFSMWPKDFKEKFSSYKISLCEHKIDESDIPVMFQRLNGGIALTTAQRRRGEISQKLMFLEGFVKDSIWKTIDAKLTRDQIEMVVMQALVTWNSSGKTENKSGAVIDAMKMIDVEKLFSQFSKKFLYFKSFYEQSGLNADDQASLKRACKKVHAASILAIMPDGDYDPRIKSQINERLIKFFGETGKDRSIDRLTYSTYATTDTGSQSHVSGLYEILQGVLSKESKLK